VSVLKQFHRVLEDESARLYLHRIDFGRRWDIRIDMQAMVEHNRVCREIIRAANKENDILQLKRDDRLLDVVVDVDHWGDEA